MSFTVIRTHEICAGHRVVGHESKCRHLHGHNYVFHFKVQPKLATTRRFNKGEDITLHDPEPLDKVGRVVDFSVVKSTLCEWLEENWDHKFLHWEKDQLINALRVERSVYSNDEKGFDEASDDTLHFTDSLVALPFNPTAENLAQYMVDVVGPSLLTEHGVELTKCVIEETSKCHVEYSL